MAVVAARVSVTVAATKLCENVSAGTDANTRSYLLIPQAVTGVVALGPIGVTSATGARWDVAAGPLSIDLEPGESLYGIVPAGAASVAVDVMSAGR